MKSQITGIDWVVIGLYFSILLCVATWVVRKSKESASDYFLAGRNLGWWVIGASIFAVGVLENVSEGSERALFWGVADATLLFACVSIEKRWGWPKWGFLSKLGDASYSVFLSHLFALALTTNILRELRLFPILGVSGARIVFLGAAWTMGVIVYSAIERPMMRYFDRGRADGLIPARRS